MLIEHCTLVLVTVCMHACLDDVERPKPRLSDENRIWTIDSGSNVSADVTTGTVETSASPVRACMLCVKSQWKTFRILCVEPGITPCVETGVAPNITPIVENGITPCVQPSNTPWDDRGVLMTS